MRIALDIIAERMCTFRKKKEIMPLAPRIGLILFALLLVADPVCAWCDEAVDITGRRHAGRLQLVQENWEFADKNAKQIPVKQLAYVRFELKDSLPVKVRLSKTFLLPDGQRLTGSLVRIDDKAI